METKDNLPDREKAIDEYLHKHLSDVKTRNYTDMLSMGIYYDHIKPLEDKIGQQQSLIEVLSVKWNNVEIRELIKQIRIQGQLEQKSNKEMSNENEYTCAMCFNTYEYERSEEEAIQEAKENFGDNAFEQEAMDVICDDCYLKLSARFPM